MKKSRPSEALRRALQLVNARFSAKRSGLSIPQIVILTALQEGPLKQARMIDTTGMDRTTASRVVARLCWLHFVESDIAPDDERANMLRITKRGLDALNRADGPLSDAEAHVMRRVDPADRAAFLRGLRAIAEASP